MSKNFGLLKVTSVALREILSQFELNEIFALSLCSRKTFGIVAHHRKKSINQRFFVDTRVEDDFKVGFNESKVMVCLKSFSESHHEHVQIEGHETPICKEADQFCTFWKSPRSGLKFFINHICTLFRIDIDTLYCTSEWSYLLVGERQTTLRMLYIDKMTSYNYIATGIFWKNKICTISCLHFNYHFDDGFAVPVALKRFEFVRLKLGAWSHLGNMIRVAQNCSEVILDDWWPRFDWINEFFERWLHGEFQDLKFLSIGLKRHQADDVVQRIIHHLVFVEEEMTFEDYMGDKHRLFPGPGIRRNDGTIASLFYREDTKKLQFGVVAGITTWRPYGNRL